MWTNKIRLAVLAFLVLVFLACSAGLPAQVEKPSYPAMAPLEQYLIPDENAEIALARSAAPASISEGAEVMVLRRDGYAAAVKGSNGFVCIVERSWAKPTDDPEFWNSRVRAPTCFNPASLTCDVKRIGFADVQIFGPTEMNARYCRDREDGLRVPHRLCLVKARV